MIIGGLARSSTVDFPGKLSCVVFVRGCNLDCFYCHNRELIGACISGARREETGMSADEVLGFLAKRKGLLDGVVVSGGEPTLQPDLMDFLSKVREVGYAIKLDSNGQKPEVVQHAVAEGLVDYVAIDYKARAADYRGVCGGDASKTIRTIEGLLASPVEFEVRTTVYPGMSPEMLAGALREVPQVPRYRLNAFIMPQSYRQDDESRLHEAALTRNDIKALVPRLRAIQPNLLDVL